MEQFEETIKEYLDRKAEENSLFAAKYANGKKNIQECCQYIMGEAKKRGNAVFMSDDEVYGLAVHYYEEEDIKVNTRIGSASVSVSSSDKVELTEDEKAEARRIAIEKAASEMRMQMQRKAIRNTTKPTEVQQPTLF